MKTEEEYKIKWIPETREFDNREINRIKKAVDNAIREKLEKK